MDLRRFLGLDPAPSRGGRSRQDEEAAETATVRRIVSELDALEPDQRRFLAGFAYILSRAAHADLAISDEESRLIERVVMDVGKLPERQAVLVVQLAKHQTELYGGTEDYLVTREFAGRATEQQRLALLEACFAVAAAGDSISAEEYAELTQIARELDLGRDQLNEVRRAYRDHLAAIRRMRGEQAG